MPVFLKVDEVYNGIAVRLQMLQGMKDRMVFYRRCYNVPDAIGVHRTH